MKLFWRIYDARVAVTDAGMSPMAERSFGSPRRLNLRLDCTRKTRVRDTLDVWPALPLVIRAAVTETNVDDIVAVLEHTDRVNMSEGRKI